MKHVKSSTKLADYKTIEPCLGLDGLAFYKCRKQNPVIA